MTTLSTFEVCLAALLLTVAAWTVITRHVVVAVIAFVVHGLILAIVWVRLAAVDVALTEAAIGGGMTGILLLGAATRLRNADASARPGTPACLAAALICLAASAGLVAVVLMLPDAAPTLAPIAMANLPETGLGNPVAGVLFVYRALDTLLEKVVLLLALVGVWSLAPDHLWGGIPGLRAFQPNGVLVLFARLLAPVGIIVGVYLFWVGAKRPGGAFQGGTVLAAMWLLVVLAGLEDIPPIDRRWIRSLLVIGPATFVAIGFAGFVFADAFLAYPAGYAKPLIVTAEATLTLSIAIALALLVAGPPGREQRQ